MGKGLPKFTVSFSRMNSLITEVELREKTFPTFTALTRSFSCVRSVITEGRAGGKRFHTFMAHIAVFFESSLRINEDRFVT